MKTYMTMGPIALGMALVAALVINGRFGHATGDRVLRELARLLENNLRAEDSPARFGGQELVVALYHSGPRGQWPRRSRSGPWLPAIAFGDEDGRVTMGLTVSGGVAADTPRPWGVRRESMPG